MELNCHIGFRSSRSISSLGSIFFTDEEEQNRQGRRGGEVGIYRKSVSYGFAPL